MKPRIGAESDFEVRRCSEGTNGACVVARGISACLLVYPSAILMYTRLNNHL